MTAFLDIKEVLSVGRAGFLAATSQSDMGDIQVRQVDANINAALGVCDGTTPGKTVKAPTTALEAKRLRGILIDPEFKNQTDAAADYLANDSASYLERGTIWVNAEGTVAVGDDVYVRFASDGGSNTTLGTFRNDNDTPSGGIVLTPTASPVQTTTGGYLVRLRDKAGHDETFVYDADSTATVGEIAAGLVALIDASPNFVATGSTTVTVTAAAGGQVEVLQLGEHVTVTTGARAERVENAEWVSAVTGAGLAKIRLYKSPFQKKAS
jgi:hypothetical protein